MWRSTGAYLHRAGSALEKFRVGRKHWKDFFPRFDNETPKQSTLCLRGLFAHSKRYVTYCKGGGGPYDENARIRKHSPETREKFNVNLANQNKQSSRLARFHETNQKILRDYSVSNPIHVYMYIAFEVKFRMSL